MKIEVCSHCDNCGEGDICSRYKRHVSKVKCCGLYGLKFFNKPFNGRGVKHQIGHRAEHVNPLHLKKERKV